MTDFPLTRYPDPVAYLYNEVNTKGYSDLAGVVLSNVSVLASGRRDYGYETSGNTARTSINGTSFQFHTVGNTLDMSVFIPSVNVDYFAEDVVFAQNILQETAESVDLPTGTINFTLGFVTLPWESLTARGDAEECLVEF